MVFERWVELEVEELATVSLFQFFRGRRSSRTRRVEKERLCFPLVSVFVVRFSLPVSRRSLLQDSLQHLLQDIIQYIQIQI